MTAKHPAYRSLRFRPVVVSRTVLVADGDAVRRSGLVAEIRNDGYNVVEVENGFQLLQLAQSSSPPDVAVVSARLPDGSGLNVCERLIDQGISLPLILIATERSAELYSEAERVGVSYVLPANDTDRLMIAIASVMHGW